MLVLTRKVGQSIRISDDITITVVGVDGNNIKVGVSAPKEVEVHREEIFQRIQLEKAGLKPAKKASKLSPELV